MTSSTLAIDSNQESLEVSPPHFHTDITDVKPHPLYDVLDGPRPPG